MKKLLRIDSSVRSTGSVSSSIADIFCEKWSIANPNSSITKRHVGLNTPSHPSQLYTVANYTPEDSRTDEMNQALKESDELIDELAEHQELLFAIPMYNFSVPSTFKAYIDNLVRVGRTFAVGADGFSGLLNEKKLTVISSRGGAYTPPSPAEPFDLMTPYVKTVMGFMGIVDVTFVVAENLDFSGPEQKTIEVEKAERAVHQLFE